jgi:hypothetical protein
MVVRPSQGYLGGLYDDSALFIGYYPHCSIDLKPTQSYRRSV